MTNPFSFPSPENNIIYPSFLKLFCHTFGASEKCHTSFWPLGFRREITVIQIDVSLYVMRHFSLSVFKILSLSLVFLIIMMMCIGIDLFGHILFWVHSTSLLCRLMSFPKFGKFSAIVFGHILSLALTFYSPSGTLTMQVMDLCLLSQRFQGSVILKLLSCIISFLQTGSILLLCLQVHWFYPLSSSLHYLIHTTSFLFTVNFSMLNNPFCSFCNLYFFAETFLIYVERCCIWMLKYFYDSCLKSLSDHFNIWFISVMTLVDVFSHSSCGFLGS